jgi:hypothetical protein
VADDVGLIPSLVGAERLDEMLVAALSLLEAEISPVAVSPNAISN